MHYILYIYMYIYVYIYIYTCTQTIHIVPQKQLVFCGFAAIHSYNFGTFHRSESRSFYWRLRTWSNSDATMEVRDMTVFVVATARAGAWKTTAPRFLGCVLKAALGWQWPRFWVWPVAYWGLLHESQSLRGPCAKMWEIFLVGWNVLDLDWV